jgi:biotin operon repressor
MQDIADILRERDVSWAAIGQALAVSRQAAWKRFGSST